LALVAPLVENLEQAGRAVAANLALIEQVAAARLVPIGLLLPARQVWMVAVEPASSAQTRAAGGPVEKQGFRRARVVFRQVVFPPGVALPLRIGLAQAAVVFPLRIGLEGEMAVLLARAALLLVGLERAAVVVERQDQRYRRYKG
jgi:hypothetical protein